MLAKPYRSIGLSKHIHLFVIAASGSPHDIPGVYYYYQSQVESMQRHKKASLWSLLFLEVDSWNKRAKHTDTIQR